MSAARRARRVVAPGFLAFTLIGCEQQRSSGDVASDARERATEDSVFTALGFANKPADDVVVAAREMAAAGRHEDARRVLRRVLRDTPDHHDARALLGRTYGWQERFDEGRPILEDLVRRAPDYADGHVALIDLELWAQRAPRALALADSALARLPGNGGIVVRKARALELLGQTQQALAVLRAVPAGDPASGDAEQIRRRLPR